jgi:molybdate transport system substrate-binding protein
MASIDSEPAHPIRGISSMATRHLLAELAEAYRQRSGRPAAIESVGGMDAAKRVQSGEALDFVVLAADALERLAAGGHVVPASRIDIARSGVAIAVKSGSRRPDVTNERAVRDAVLAARSVGYSTGPSGTHLVQLFERWGIAEAIASRIVQAPAGVPVGTLVGNGDVELGFQQLSELIAVPGIEVLGPLPQEIQIVTVFAGAVCRTAAQPRAAGAFLSFLASPDADAAKLRHGMEPARSERDSPTAGGSAS